MGQLCSNICKRLTENSEWLTTFVTYGDPVRTNNYDNDESMPIESSDDSHRKKYNGLIASVDLLVALATIALTVSITPYMADEPHQAVNIVPEIVLILFMLLGLSMLFLFSHRKDSFVRKEASGKKAHNWKNLDRILLMVGLVLFYIFAFVLDMFHCFAQIDCAAEWMKIDNGNAVSIYAIDVVYHFVRTIYLGCSTLFVFIFGHALMANKCWVRYGLVILFGSNLAIWFDVLLHESIVSSNESNNTAPIRINGLNCSNASSMEEKYDISTIDCLCFRTNIFILLKKNISPVCYPFMYECSFMLGERFIHWFYNCSPSVDHKKKISKKLRKATDNNNLQNSQSNMTSGELVHIDNDAIVEENESDESIEDDLGDSFDSEDIYHPHYTDDSDQENRLEHSRTPSVGNQIILSEGNSNMMQDHGVEYLNPIRKCRTCRRNVCRCEDMGSSRHLIYQNPEDFPLQDKPANMMMYTIFFLITISTNVLFLILALLPSLVGKENEQFPHMFLYYSSFYYAFVLLMTLIGFVTARNFPLRRSRSILHGLDYLLLLSASGPFAFNILSLVTIMFRPSVLDKKNLKLSTALLLQILNLVEVYVQIPFCFFSSHVIALNPDGTRRPGAKYFQAVLIYMSVSNATLWIVNSFATTFNGVNVYFSREFFHDIWDIVNSSVLPMTLFFRFNSALLLLKALRMAFKKPSTNTGNGSTRFNSNSNSN